MNKKPRLPGDPTEEDYIHEVIRVNHAGEFGAKRIYEGQIAVTSNPNAKAIITSMKDQELKHLEYFEKQIALRQVRPTILQPLWNVAGFALGVVTGLLGEKAAMACTEAVEEVINEHYEEQIEKVPSIEEELKAKIIQFNKEEEEHKNIAIENNSKYAIAYPILSGLIKAGCRLAINLSKRI